MAQNQLGFVPLPGRLVQLPGRAAAPYNPNFPLEPIPMQPPVQPGQSAWTTAINMANSAERAWSQVSPELRGRLRDLANPNNSKGDKPPMATQPNTQSPTSDGTLTTKHSTGYSLYTAPKPAPVHLDTGIIPNTYSSDVMNAVEDVCSPLHVTCAKLYLPSVADTTAPDLYSYFKNVIGFDIQSKAQSNVGFKLDISTILTVDNIRDFLNDVLYALQIYMYYRGIMAFGMNTANKNEGMTTLRQGLTPDDILNLNELGMRLADTPIPPKMLDAVRYLFSTFASGDSSGATLLKIVPLASSDTMLDSNAIVNALNALNGETVSSVTHAKNPEVAALLRRSVRHWVNPNIMDPPDIPLYDPQFKSIFSNLPFVYYNGTTIAKVPSVTSVSQEIDYNSFTNSLDGAAFAFTSIYVSGNYKPLLLTPLAGATVDANGNSRRSFYAVSGVKKFYPVQSYNFLKRSRQESYTLDATNAVVTNHLAGAVRCKGVSYNSLIETSYKVFDYLLSLDTIKSNQQYPGLGTPNQNTGGSRRPRSRAWQNRKK